MLPREAAGPANPFATATAMQILPITKSIEAISPKKKSRKIIHSFYP